jgi:hypothetical protein
MTPRRLLVLAAVALALSAGGLAWHLARPEPVITEERARSIQVGMTKAEVAALLGGPAGDYAANAVVTYLRGSVGGDATGYYQGTNWWGRGGMIQVQFSEEGRVESAAYYPAPFVRRLDFWERLRGGLTLAPQRNRHDWVPGGW